MSTEMTSKRPLLLYVENSDDDAFLFACAVKRCGAGFDVRVVEDFPSTQDYLLGRGRFSDRARFPFPSMVLLDFTLPGANGGEVARWIRAQDACKDLLLVVFSGSPHPTSIALSYASGADVFLSKCTGNPLHEIISCLGKAMTSGLYERFMLLSTFRPPPISPGMATGLGADEI
jgi:CheY-like chemotaxis protein